MQRKLLISVPDLNLSHIFEMYIKHNREMTVFWVTAVFSSRIMTLEEAQRWMFWILTALFSTVTTALAAITAANWRQRRRFNGSYAGKASRLYVAPPTPEGFLDDESLQFHRIVDPKLKVKRSTVDELRDAIAPLVAPDDLILIISFDKSKLNNLLDY